MTFPRPLTRPLLTALLLALGALTLPSVAAASDLVDRRTSGERLQVNSRGVALVTYRSAGKRRHVLYWGASNANMRDRSTLRFRLDRSGGWKSGKADWQNFDNSCRRYRGPKLPYVVSACTARDGSHWVLQKWARVTPNYGGNPARYWKELRLSHFTRPPAELTVYPNWSWSGRYFHVAATLRYAGRPWYALQFRPNGYVTDQIGRNVTIDSLNSDLGRGWRRVNAVLTHRPSGQLCYGFTPKDNGRGGLSGTGYSRSNTYRMVVPGPGVSPDVAKVFNGLRLEDYSVASDAPLNDRIRGLIGSYDGRHSCQSIN